MGMCAIHLANSTTLPTSLFISPKHMTKSFNLNNVLYLDSTTEDIIWTNNFLALIIWAQYNFQAFLGIGTSEIVSDKSV